MNQPPEISSPIVLPTGMSMVTKYFLWQFWLTKRASLGLIWFWAHWTLSFFQNTSFHIIISCQKYCNLILHIYRINSSYARTKSSQKCKWKTSIFTNWISYILTEFLKFYKCFSPDTGNRFTFYLLLPSQGFLGCSGFSKNQTRKWYVKQKAGGGTKGDYFVYDNHKRHCQKKANRKEMRWQMLMIMKSSMWQSIKRLCQGFCPDMSHRGNYHGSM